MVLYKILKQRHPEYSKDHIEKQRLLYCGGYEIQKSAKRFLTKLSIERPQCYKERCDQVAYTPFVSQFTDAFSAALFSDELKIHQSADGYALDPAYDAFFQDADQKNNSLHNFLKDTFTESLYRDQAFVHIDFPPSNTAETIADEKTKGLAIPYLSRIDPTSIINWEMRDDDEEKFRWVRIENDCTWKDPFAEKAQHQLQYMTLQLVNGFCTWTFHESPLLDLGKQVDDGYDFGPGTTLPTSFKEINILPCRIKDGIHVGNNIGPMAIEFYQRYSFLTYNANKTCVAIPVIKLGPEMSAPGEPPPAERQSDPNRGSTFKAELQNEGFTVLGAGDDIEVVESLGSSHQFISDELTNLAERMHQTVHQMANSAETNSKALGRSGDSKEEDRHATEILLSAYSRTMKDFTLELMTLISEARNETPDWKIDGLSTFVEENRADLVNELKALAPNGNVLQLLPSPTLHKLYLTHLGLNLIDGATDDEAATIKDELEQAIEQGDHLPPDPNDPSQQPASQQLQPGPGSPQDQASGTQAQTQGALVPTQPDPSNIHDRSVSTAGIGETVFNQLSQDYDPTLLGWVRAAHWVGPVDIPIENIDLSNRDNWKANEDDDQVGDMQDKMQQGWMKPIILANEPNGNKLMLIDGRHRLLATEAQGEDSIKAFVAYVGSVGGDWEKLHALQGEGDQEISAQKMQSKLQEVSKQTQ